MTSVIDNLRSYKTGLVRYNDLPLKNKYFTLEETITESYNPDYSYELRTEAILGFSQHISSNADDIILKLSKERAAIAISRELYKDVLKDLYEIQEEIWRNNPRYNNEVQEKVSKLIDKLELR